MADQITQDEQGRTYRNGVLDVHTGTPGAAGAIHDLVQALAGALGPKSITQAPQRMQQQMNQSDPAPTAPLGSQF
jgi:hypothetical protein